MVVRNGLAAMIRGEQAKIAFSPSTTVRSVGVSVAVGGGVERERERESLLKSGANETLNHH